MAEGDVDVAFRDRHGPTMYRDSFLLSTGSRVAHSMEHQLAQWEPPMLQFPLLHEKAGKPWIRSGQDADQDHVHLGHVQVTISRARDMCRSPLACAGHQTDEILLDWSHNTAYVRTDSTTLEKSAKQWQTKPIIPILPCLIQHHNRINLGEWRLV